MKNTFCVGLRVEETVKLLEKSILKEALSGVRLDHHPLAVGDGRRVDVLVFEKHFMRIGGRLTLTVVVDDLEGQTRVHWVSGGGGNAMFRFDWGAGKNFEAAVRTVLAGYAIPCS